MWYYYWFCWEASLKLSLHFFSNLKQKIGDRSYIYDITTVFVEKLVSNFHYVFPLTLNKKEDIPEIYYLWSYLEASHSYALRVLYRK